LGKNIALVLSGGGARGLAHIGVIEELEKNGYNITSIAGTSMGALIGGIYATGKLDIFKKWILSLSKYSVYKLMDFTLNLGFIKMDKVFKKLKEIIGDWDFSDLSIDLKIIATDLSNKEEIIFSKGNLFDAIRSSIAYPTIITPHYINGKIYVDGGIVNPLPINRVKRFEGDILIAVDLSSNIKFIKQYKQVKISYLRKIIKSWSGSKGKKEQWSYIKLIDQSLNTMSYQLSKMILKNNNPDILIEISSESAGFFDYYDAKNLISYGKTQTIIKLKKIKY